MNSRGKHDPAVLVDVGGRHAEHLVELLHGAVGVHRRGRNHGRLRRWPHRGMGVHQRLRNSDIVRRHDGVPSSVSTCW